MCIAYSDLNNIFPTDHYPLPEIDQKILSLEGFQYKSFLDNYKGYHQVQMRREDEEKNAFHIDRDTFCYQKMPFGLKNVWETYQRLMEKVFANQICRNVKVYVDDMVIKNHNEATLFRDIEETFQTFTKMKMKLNVDKYTFGVEECQLLGYQITK